MTTKAEVIQRRKQPLIVEQRDLKSSLDNARDESKHLDSQSGQQEAKLGRLSGDSLRAYRWVRQNQDQFEKEVFGPVAVTCSVTDPKYADAIESLLQRNDLTAFTTQTMKDFRTLQKAFKANGLWDVTIKTCREPLSSIPTPLPDHELKQLGFDGWAKDFLKGPEPVIASLCVENRFNQTPVALRDISEEAFNRLQNGEVGRINSWVSGPSSYQVSRRTEYGAGAKSTRVRKVNPARIWTSQGVDISLKQQHQEKIQQCEAGLEQVRVKLEEEKKQIGELSRKHDEIEEEIVSRIWFDYGIHAHHFTERDRSRESRETDSLYPISCNSREDR